MICERCKEREATTHVTEVRGDKEPSTTHNYCQDCWMDAEGGGVSAGTRVAGWTSYDFPNLHVSHVERED